MTRPPQGVEGPGPGAPEVGHEYGEVTEPPPSPLQQQWELRSLDSPSQQMVPHCWYQ